MNKKIFFGILGVSSLATIFVACGSGTIDSFAANDQVAELTLATSLNEETSLKACEANIECQALLNQSPVVESSSSVVQTPSSSSVAELPISSSSVAVLPISSSSLFVIASSSSVVPVSSSSLVVIASSSSVTPEGGIPGTCSPNPAIAELGQSVTWSFSKETTIPVTQILSATFDWTFEGASLETYNATGPTGISKIVTYATSGQHTATLSTNGTAPINCTPVQVNGAKITGCKCVVDNASPDVAASGIATWTVSGCETAATANITGYSWDGGESASITTSSHTFTAKDETYTPTLSVSNDDNTIQTVVCPAAKAIDATLPDCEMTASGNTAGVTFEGNVDATIVMNLASSWHNGTTGTCTFACQVNRGSGGSGAISGTVDEITMAGSDYVTASIPITSTINGYALKLSLDVGTNAGVTCFVNW